MDNLLCNCVSGGLPRDPMTEAAAGGRKGPVGSAPVSVSEVQILMTKIGLLDSLADLFSSITVTFNQFLQSDSPLGPSFVKAALKLHSGDSNSKPSYPTAVSATAPFPLACIKRLLALWLRLRQLSVKHGLHAALAGFGQTPSHGVSLGPQFQATLEPLCSLLLVLLQYEHRMGIDMSQCMTTLNGKNIAYRVVCQLVLTVPAMPKLSQLSWLRPDDTSQRPKPAVDDSMLQTPDVHALLLFMLAAVAQALHREQKGESPAVLLEPTSSHSSYEARKKQPLKVADFSVSTLQDLGVSEAQAQRLWSNFNQSGNHLPQPVKLQHHIDMVLEHLESGFSQHSKQSSSSSSSSSSSRHRQPDGLSDMLHNAIMLLKLLVQLTALRPTPQEVYDYLSYMRKISSNIVILHDVYKKDRKTSAAIRAAVAEITDSILAPFVLQVGPAVLHALEQPDCSQKLQTDIRQKWYYVLGIFQTAKLHCTGAIGPCYLEAVSTWSAVLQQQPSTAVTAVEMAVRSMTGEVEGDMINLSMLLTGSFMEAVFSNNEQYVTAANSDGSSNPALRQWHREYAAKPISLLLTFAKLYNVLSVKREDAVWVFQGIVGAVRRASNMDMDMGIKTCYGPKQAKKHSQAAVPPASWVHVIARLLHCSSLAMLRLEAGASTVVDISELTKEPDVLPAAVAWCKKKAELLHSNNSSGSTSAAAANGDSGNGPYSEILKQLHLLDQQLQQGFLRAKRSYGRLLALQLQQYAEALCAVFPTTLCCNNPSCGNVSGLSELACVGRRKCSKCQGAGYCSRECQVQHWSQHKKICSLL